MRPFIKKSFLVLFLAFGIATTAHQALGADDAIIAVVNDELISLKDLKDYVRANYVSMVAEGVNEIEIKKVMDNLQTNGIEKLIEDKLMLSQANKIGLEVREKLIDDRIEEIKQKYPSDENFTAALVKNGTTLTELRSKIKNQLKITYTIEREVKAKIFVNPQEVTEYYQQHMEEFKQKDRFNLESIHISFATDKASTRKKAQEILSKIAKGEVFSQLAKEYSDMPSIGIIEKGQMLPKVDDIVVKLAVGEVSAIVEMDNGIYIFKLLAKSPAQIASLKEAKDSVYEFIFHEKFKQNLESWLKKLKKNAYIEIKP